MDTGVFSNTSVGSVTVGDELASVPQQFCQNVSTLTSVSFGKSVSSIGWAAFQKCGNRREYSFASYPSFVGDWNQGAKSGTGVRAFVPKDVEGWANILANGEVFTPWKRCTTSQANAYYTAFGPTAQRPHGYTTVPMEMWLVTYNLKSGMKVIFR